MKQRAKYVIVMQGRSRHFATLKAAKAFCEDVFKRKKVVLGIEKCEEKLKSFHFSCGNSSKGPIGFCGRIKAHTKQEALKILRDTLPGEEDITDGMDREQWEYLCVYFNASAVTIRSIDEVDEVEEEGEDDGSPETDSNLQALQKGEG